MSKEFYRRYPRRQRSEMYREQCLSREGQMRGSVKRASRRRTHRHRF